MVFLAYLKAVAPFTSQIKLVNRISDFYREGIVLGLDQDQRKRYSIPDESTMGEKALFDPTLARIFALISMQSQRKSSFSDSENPKKRKLSLNPQKGSYESFNKSELEEKINTGGVVQKARLAVVGNDETRKTFKHSFLPQSPHLESVLIDPNEIQIEDAHGMELDVEAQSEREAMIERLTPK